MEILISIVVSILSEVVKRGAKRFGIDLTKKVIAGVVFLGAVGGAYLFDRQIITLEFLRETIQIFLIAVGYYEAVYKRILVPVFDLVVKKINKK